MQELMTCLASLTIGFSLGMIGAGGSVLTVPVFVYILGIDPVASGIYSMFVVGLSSLAGGIKSIFYKLVNFQVAALFGIPSVLGVLIARKFIFPFIPNQIFFTDSFSISKAKLLLSLVSLLMFAAALSMLSPKPGKEMKIQNDKPVKAGSLLIRGLVVGLITGLLGLGGGFLIVPALFFWAGLPMTTAIGTTLIIIAFNSTIGFLSCYQSLILDWTLLLKFSAGAVIGILLGGRLALKIPGAHLKKIFGWFVLSISAYVVFKQFTT